MLFGSVIRILTPGASFGELSLLQKNVSRTATILVPSNGSCKEARHLGAARDEESNEGHGESNADVAAPGDAAPSNRRFDGVELIRVTRECYDRTVSQLMSKQLADLLEFLSQVLSLKDVAWIGKPGPFCQREALVMSDR